MISFEPLFETILEIVERENQYLKELNKDIFFIPELALSYQIGKAVVSNPSIFNSYKYKWFREKKYVNYGLADVIFELPELNHTLVVEFKMDGSYKRDYLQDIIKLRKLKGKDFTKLFCSLKWVYAEEVDEIIDKMKHTFEAGLIDHKAIDIYISGNNRHNQCLISLWQVS